MKKLFSTIAILVFVILAFGCGERYRVIKFDGVEVRTTIKMHPWLIYSNKNIPTPMYISTKDKCLKLDSEITKDEIKTFLSYAKIDYVEQYTGDRIGADYYIIAGCFEFYYQHGKLLRYVILPDKKIVDGVALSLANISLWTSRLNNKVEVCLS